jgi:hypothetical protein
MSEEMKSLEFTDFGYVDLFLNDYNGLRKCILSRLISKNQYSIRSSELN